MNCGGLMEKGTDANYEINMGVVHISCPVEGDELPTDDTRLIIEEQDDDFYLK